MKVLVGVLLVLLAALQWRLWFGDGSLQELSRLRDESEHSRSEVVADLKSGLDAIEERARGELGMISEGETFYRFIREKNTSKTRSSGANEVSGNERSQLLTDQIGTPVNAAKEGVSQ